MKYVVEVALACCSDTIYVRIHLRNNPKGRFNKESLQDVSGSWTTSVGNERGEIVLSVLTDRAN